ncbi:MAG TPA: DUF1549 domain-containing protein, partial [Pirellulaceae bacterium]|nr:DUF1549 domain-containing protein [Pirellulaceae bacterium]
RRTEELRLDLSLPADDGEFLRRATLDVTGVTPTVAETRAFLGSQAPDKRAQKIEELLRHPRRAAWWASHLCDQTVCNVEHLGAPVEFRARRAKMWHDWFRKRVADNMPYDQIARGVLCATSLGGEGRDVWIDRAAELEAAAQAGFESNYAERADLDLFWRRLGPTGPLPVEDVAELAASAFLGLQLRCARCHQHPYDRWTQGDFAAFANIFARIEYGSSTDLRQAMTARLERRREARAAGRTEPELPRLQEVFLAERPRPLVDAASAGERRLRAPGGPEFDEVGDPRTALFGWLTRADNPYFAPNLVNRVWARYFGAGLVEPLDGFSRSNPATHPRLLQRLSDDFVRSGYDLRALERTILSSAAYQRSARPRGNNAADQRCLSHAPVRPVPAAALVDSIHQALEVAANFGPDAPPGCQAIELAVNQFERPETQSMFRALGRRERRTLCDCESNVGQSLRSELFLLSDAELVTKLNQGRVARLAAAGASPADAIEELYLATVSRLPSAQERAVALEHVAHGENVKAGLADLMWALLNSREFLTNH